MTKKHFEKLAKKYGFTHAMEALYEESNFLTTYEMLKEFAIQQLKDDDVGFTLHILNAIWNSKGDSDYYYYDYTAGTCCTPQCLNTIEDVETYIGFEE